MRDKAEKLAGANMRVLNRRAFLQNIMSPSAWNKRKKALAPLQRAEWRSWCDENAKWIAASGVPSEVFADLDHWRSFLEIGDLSPPDFDVSKLSLPQKIALLR